MQPHLAGLIEVEVGHRPIIGRRAIWLEFASNPASQYAGRMKATFDLDADLYRALKVEAARSDRSVRDVVEEALEAWLARAEELEDRASAGDALKEYQRDGGVSADEWFRHMAAETKLAYRQEGE